MTDQPRINATTVPDPELRSWLSAERDDGTRELIVEADLPKRTVRFGKTQQGRQVASGVDSGPQADRERLLQELADFLSGLNTEANVLKSAGAVAVRSDREQARAIVNHPLVRAVRPNRRLG